MTAEKPNFEFFEKELEKFKKIYGEIADVDTIASISDDVEGSEIYHDVEVMMYAMLDADADHSHIMKYWTDHIASDVIEWAKAKKERLVL